ncbi:TPA: hypothetical protein R1871_000544 [Klebsiella oxytoca]|nr:hypothetical protein [Klebsiella oxytoca]HEC2043609.1 hypothetical protein [Klebsiella oxytoca]
MDLGLLTWLFDKIAEFAGYQKAKRLAAIEGLTPAVAATIAYNERINSGYARNDAEERRLHELWYTASSAVSRYDRELARVCKEKAQYWLRYDEYNDGHVEELNIKLKSVAQRLEDLKYP